MTDGALPPRKVSRGSLAIACVSTVVEWYDFTLYLYLAPTLARVFFGIGEGALAETLAGFAVAYLLRPFGALVFGQIGDRFGRRRAMLLSVALMTVSMLATAALPTEAQMGAAAGWALLALRCVSSFAVGGEYVGVVAYLLEGAKAERRGLVTSCASATSEIGALLAVGVCALTVGMLAGPDLDAWGWRIPFVVGAALAAGVWIARSAMEESPEFERQQATDATPKTPLRDMLTTHRKAVARGFAISSLGSITYYVGITYVPSFLASAGVRTEGEALSLSTAAAVAVILATPIAGVLSDRFGRKPVLLSVALLSAALPVAMFALVANGAAPAALAGAVTLAAIAGGVSAVGAVATAELLPGEGRLTGLALGATGATAIFGGLAPYLAHRLVEATGWAGTPGLMIAAVAAVVLPVLAAMPETAPSAAERRAHP